MTSARTRKQRSPCSHEFGHGENFENSNARECDDLQLIRGMSVTFHLLVLPLT